LKFAETKSIEEIANREGCSPRKVNMTLSLAFLSPAIPRRRRRQLLQPRLCFLQIALACDVSIHYDPDIRL
jgi:hypothetical protein